MIRSCDIPSELSLDSSILYFLFNKANTINRVREYFYVIETDHLGQYLIYVLLLVLYLLYVSFFFLVKISLAASNQERTTKILSRYETFARVRRAIKTDVWCNDDN